MKVEWLIMILNNPIHKLNLLESATMEYSAEWKKKQNEKQLNAYLNNQSIILFLCK